MEVEDNNDGSYKVTFTPKCIGKATIIASISGQKVKESPYNVIVHCDLKNVIIVTLSNEDISEDSK